MFSEEIKKIKIFKKLKKQHETRLFFGMMLILFYLSTVFFHNILLTKEIISFSFTPIFIIEIIGLAAYFAYIKIDQWRKGVLNNPKTESEFIIDADLITSAIYLEFYYEKEDLSFSEKTYFFNLLSKIGKEDNIETLVKLLETKIISDPTKKFLKESLLKRIEEVSNKVNIEESEIVTLEKTLMKLKEKQSIKEKNVSIITND